MKAELIIKNRKSSEGSVLVEVLIALALLSFGISAVLLLSTANQDLKVDSQTNNEALAKAQQQLETMRALSRQDISLVQNCDDTASPQCSGGVDPFYGRKVTVTNIDSFSKQVVSEVSYSVSPTRTQSVKLSTIVADWNSALSGDTCSQTVNGDWTMPQIYGYVDFSSSAGATGVDVRGTKAYVTSDPSSSLTDDFYVIDVSTAAPATRSLPILGHFSTTYGLTDVRTAGMYSYVTANSTAFQLLVIDVSDPSNLDISKIIAKRDVTASGDTAIGNVVFYANKKIYLGLTKSNGPEFHIFDVSSPANPVEVGPGYEVGGAINDIVVKNNIAYLATAANNEVIALDVSDPTNPTRIGTYTSVTLTGQSLALAKTTPTLYFGRIGGNGNPKLLEFDTANLATPAWTMDMSKQSGVYTMALRGNLLFMTTADPNDGLQIWDISGASATTPPTRYDTTPLNIQQTATAGTDCSGNLLYIAQRSNRALQIIGPYVPPFDYSLAASKANLTINQGFSGTNTITVTMIAGAAPQTVSLTFSGLQNNVTVSPAPASCTPSGGSCNVVFTITAASNAQKKTNIITVKGTSPAESTTFQLTIQ